ncbi:MAG: hypothetical protein IJ642_02995 [Oscillospiraceae bacterium]|nr:hypothetical protein [Oscillospiraceae bacterium]
MLTKLLSHASCADCKECCVFSLYDIWAQPALSPENQQKARQLLPQAEFIHKGKESFLFRVQETVTADLFLCPLLDTEKGCLLGAEKPFECQIYPFQVTELNHRLAIMLSPLCEVMIQQPLGTLLEVLKTELAEKLFSYAEQHPDVIRPYDDRNPVLLWKDQNFENYLEELNHVESKL